MGSGERSVYNLKGVIQSISKKSIPDKMVYQ